MTAGKDKGKDGNGSAMVVDGDHQSNLPIDDSEAEAHRQLHLLVDDSEQCLLALRALLRLALFLQCDLPPAPSGNALASRYVPDNRVYYACLLLLLLLVISASTTIISLDIPS